MAKKDGKKFRIYIVDGGNTAIPLETTASFGIENAIIDASDKDSGGWQENIDGQRSWNAESSVNYDAAQTGQIDLLDKIIDTDNSTQVSVLIGEDSVAGDIAWSGTALLASTNVSGDNNALITMDVSLTGTGGLTKVTKAP